LTNLFPKKQSRSKIGKISEIERYQQARQQGSGRQRQMSVSPFFVTSIIREVDKRRHTRRKEE
jgi:hypothetical protein